MIQRLIMPASSMDGYDRLEPFDARIGNSVLLRDTNKSRGVTHTLYS